MSRIFYRFLWNLSEYTGIGLGKLAPYVFQQMIGGYGMKKILTDNESEPIKVEQSPEGR